MCIIWTNEHCARNPGPFNTYESRIELSIFSGLNQPKTEEFRRYFSKWQAILIFFIVKQGKDLVLPVFSLLN